MYPEFVEVATHEKITAAIRTFTFALKVESVYAVLYQDALDNLEKRQVRITPTMYAGTVVVRSRS